MSELEERKTYYPNGQICTHSHYVNGKMHGDCKSYYDNGQLWAHCNYVNGKMHGDYKSYHDNGQLSEHYHCLNGKLHGEYKSYYSDGQLSEHHYYYLNGVDITAKLVNEFELSNLSREDELVIKLRWG